LTFQGGLDPFGGGRLVVRCLEELATGGSTLTADGLVTGTGIAIHLLSDIGVTTVVTPDA
jgi:hypothetical protein